MNTGYWITIQTRHGMAMPRNGQLLVTTNVKVTNLTAEEVGLSVSRFPVMNAQQLICDHKHTL